MLEREPDDRLTPAAVLVPWIKGAAGVELLCVCRAAGLRHHRGQVAFPGGRYDPRRDDGLWSTALREAREEVGLRADQVELLGALPERRTMTSQYRVQPFVVRVAAEARMRPDGREIERLLRVPLQRFRRPRSEVYRWEYRGMLVELPCVRIDDVVIWGLTLQIVDDLLAALACGDLVEPSD
jgi:8-oxo-dGTP pyrophosphatase MutT (NUDIX family)